MKVRLGYGQYYNETDGTNEGPNSTTRIHAVASSAALQKDSKLYVRGDARTTHSRQFYTYASMAWNGIWTKILDIFYYNDNWYH